MKLLLDTHFLLWLMRDPAELKQGEREAIACAQHRYVSALSIWELRIKWNSLDRNGRRKGVVSPDDALAFLLRSDVELREIAASDFAAELIQPPSHRDPFDEMLLVHAQRLGARLLTRDRNLLAHPIAYRA